MSHQAKESPLQHIAKVHVSCIKRFVASEHLREANVGSIGNNFKNLFLNKVEENVRDATLNIHRLTENSNNPSIIAELGDKSKIKLAHLFALFRRRFRYGQGHLLVNESAKIAYIADIDEKLRVVNFSWCLFRNFWIVGALPVDYPLGWGVNGQVISYD